LSHPSRRYEKAFVFVIQDVNGSGVDPAGFAALNLEEVIVGGAKTPSDEDSKEPIEPSLECAWGKICCRHRLLL
jgi:hypothetical protein